MGPRYFLMHDVWPVYYLKPFQRTKLVRPSRRFRTQVPLYTGSCALLRSTGLRPCFRLPGRLPLGGAAIPPPARSLQGHGLTLQGKSRWGVRGASNRQSSGTTKTWLKALTMVPGVPKPNQRRPSTSMSASPKRKGRRGGCPGSSNS